METVDLIKNEEIEIEDTQIKIEDIKIEEISKQNHELQSPNTKNDNVTVQPLQKNKNLYNTIFFKHRYSQSKIFHACHICSKVSSSPEELTEHLKTIHRPLTVHFHNATDLFFCDTCQVLHREIIKDNHWPCNAVDIKCFFCLTSMPLENHFVNHALTWHNFRQFQCNYCNIDTKKFTFIELNVHMKLHNKMGVYKCVRCKVFLSKYLLERHVDLCHKGCTCSMKICCCDKFNEDFYNKKIRKTDVKIRKTKTDVLDKDSTPTSNIIWCSTEDKPEKTPQISDIYTNSSPKSSQINSDPLEIKSFNKNIVHEQSENTKNLQMAINPSGSILKNYLLTKSKISLRNINELRENTNKSTKLNLICNNICSTDKVNNSMNLSQNSTQKIKKRLLKPNLNYSKSPEVLKNKKNNQLLEIIKKSENKNSLNNKNNKQDTLTIICPKKIISNSKLTVEKTKKSREKVFQNGEQTSKQIKKKLSKPNLTYKKQFKPIKNNKLDHVSMQNNNEQENADKVETFSENILQNGGHNSEYNLTSVKRFNPTKNNELDQTSIQNNKEQQNVNKHIVLNSDRVETCTKNILQNDGSKSTQFKINLSEPNLTYVKSFEPTKNNELLVDETLEQNNKDQGNTDKQIVLNSDKLETFSENRGCNSTQIKENPSKPIRTYGKRFKPTKNNELIVDQTLIQNNKEQENAGNKIVSNADKLEICLENIHQNDGRNSSQIEKNPTESNLTYVKRLKPSKNNELDQICIQNNKEQENTHKQIVLNLDKLELCSENIQNGGHSSTLIEKNPSEPNLTYVKRYKPTKNNELFVDQTPIQNNNEQEKADKQIVSNADKLEISKSNLTYVKRLKPSKNNELDQIPFQNNKKQENADINKVLIADKIETCTENILQNNKLDQTSIQKVSNADTVEAFPVNIFQNCEPNLIQIKKNPLKPVITYKKRFKPPKNNELSVDQTSIQNNTEQETPDKLTVLNAEKEEAITEKNIQNGGCNLTLPTNKQEIKKPKLTYFQRKELKFTRYCVVCNLKFSHPSLLGYHCIRMHRPWALEMLKDLYCPLCKVWFESEDKYIVHYPCKHQTITDRCPFCLMELPLKEHFTMHCVIFSHQLRVICTLCENNSKEYSIHELNRHRIREHKQNGVYECLKCKVTFSNNCDLKRHIVTVHNKSEHENLASVYKLKLNSKYQFQKYIKCSTCHQIYFSKAKLNNHKCIDVHLCSTCGQTFKASCFLKEHENKHTKLKSYDCTKCDAKFTGRRYLAQHMNIHKNKKIYSCGLCSKSFVQLTSLIYHTSSHTKENIFKCYICDIMCETQKQLSVHMGIHNADGTNPHKCKVCHKYFSHKCNLLVHMRVHPKTDEGDET